MTAEEAMQRGECREEEKKTTSTMLQMNSAEPVHQYVQEAGTGCSYTETQY